MTKQNPFNNPVSPIRLQIPLMILLVLYLVNGRVYAQTYDGLLPLRDHQVSVYFSPGADIKAKRMAAQLDRVMHFYEKQVQFTPVVTLLILSPADWNRYSRSVVYGMPHFTDSKTLIVAAENNPFWQSFIPPLENLPAAIGEKIRNAYRGKDGNLTMEPFFDLLAIHELGHAYHNQKGMKVQRKWMGELFVNIFLHSYIAEEEPGLLPALTTFPGMVASLTDTATLKFTTLDELEMHYDEIAQQYPKNYGWYQCRWHVEAGRIYDSGGLDVFRKLWTLLQGHDTITDDRAFASTLSEKVHPGVADVLLNWNAAQ